MRTSGLRTVLLRETVRYRGSCLLDREYSFTFKVMLFSAATMDIYVAPTPLTIDLVRLNVISTSGMLTSRWFRPGMHSTDTGVAH